MKRSALIVMIVPLLAIAYVVFKYMPAIWSAPCILGLFLLIAGMALVTLARIQLGDSFSVTPQARQLVTHGIYSRIRNPVYVFSSVALAGLVLYLNLPYLSLLFLILVPLQIIRARAEGRVLERRFGEPYRQYKATTWF